MTIYPPIAFSLVNGFLLILPMLALRFGIPAKYGKPQMEKVDYFPPVKGKERIALNTYFITNTFLIFSPIFARIKSSGLISTVGWVIYSVGILFLLLSLFEISKTGAYFTHTGIYKYSRNPMYIGYFSIYLGVTLIIGSWIHIMITLVYQIAVHYLILSEERWCVNKFGKDYINYYNKVSRYL